MKDDKSKIKSYIKKCTLLICALLLVLGIVEIYEKRIVTYEETLAEQITDNGNLETKTDENQNLGYVDTKEKTDPGESFLEEENAELNMEIIKDENKGSSISGFIVSLDQEEEPTVVVLNKINNEDYNVEIKEITQNALGKAIKLSVEDRTDDVNKDTVQAIIEEENLSSKLVQMTTLNMELVDEKARVVQPNGRVQVSLKIPEGMDKDSFALYYIGENGAATPQKVQGNFVGRRFLFERDHFCEFCLVSGSIENGQDSASDIANIGWFVKDANADVFFIQTGADLRGLAALTQGDVKYVNSTGFISAQGTMTALKTDFAGKTIVLGNDITMSDTIMKSIGTKANPFAGIFDGNGYTIKNLHIGESESYQEEGSSKKRTAFINELSETGEVRNIGFDNLTLVSDMSGATSYMTAAVVAENHGKIRNIYLYDSNITVITNSDNTKVAGIVALNHEGAKVENVYTYQNTISASRPGAVTDVMVANAMLGDDYRGLYSDDSSTVGNTYGLITAENIASDTLEGIAYKLNEVVAALNAVTDNYITWKIEGLTHPDFTGTKVNDKVTVYAKTVLNNELSSLPGSILYGGKTYTGIATGTVRAGFIGPSFVASTTGTNYTFKGWYSDMSGDEKYLITTNPEMTVTRFAEATYYAIYIGGPFKLKLEAVSSSEVPTTGKVYLEKEGAMSAQSLVETLVDRRTGYTVHALPGEGETFLRWEKITYEKKIEKGKEILEEKVRTVSESLIDYCAYLYTANADDGYLRAVFEPGVNVKVELTSDSTSMGTVSNANSVSTKPGKTYEVSAKPYAGYAFVGWYASADGLGEPLSTNQTYKATLPADYNETSITLYAKFRAGAGPRVQIKGEQGVIEIRDEGRRLTKVVYQYSGTTEYRWSSWLFFTRNGLGKDLNGNPKADYADNAEAYSWNTSAGYQAITSGLDKYDLVVPYTGWYTLLLYTSETDYTVATLQITEDDLQGDLVIPTINKRDNTITIEPNGQEIIAAYVQLTSTDVTATSCPTLYSTWTAFVKKGKESNLIEYNGSNGYRVMTEDSDTGVISYKLTRSGWYTVFMKYGNNYIRCQYVKITPQNIEDGKGAVIDQHANYALGENAFAVLSVKITEGNKFGITHSWTKFSELATFTDSDGTLTNNTGNVTLTGGYYNVDKNTVINGLNATADVDANPGIIIRGTVKLYIPEGVTLTVKGGNAFYEKPGAAGIELSSGNKLYLYGNGNLNTTGGNAGSGRAGGAGGNGKNVTSGKTGTYTNQTSISFDSSTTWGNTLSTGAGGVGGNGGGGAGAGIGTRGGAGGTGANSAGSLSVRFSNSTDNYQAIFDSLNGKTPKNGITGGKGGDASSIGELYASSTVVISAIGGNTNDATGGLAGNYGKSLFGNASWGDVIYYGCYGGGGGAGGGAGFEAAGIGIGGTGGNGGNSGGSGNVDAVSNHLNWGSGCNSNYRGTHAVTYGAYGAGGIGGAGSKPGANGSNVTYNKGHCNCSSASDRFAWCMLGGTGGTANTATNASIAIAPTSFTPSDDDIPNPYTEETSEYGIIVEDSKGDKQYVPSCGEQQALNYLVYLKRLKAGENYKLTPYAKYNGSYEAIGEKVGFTAAKATVASSYTASYFGTSDTGIAYSNKDTQNGLGNLDMQGAGGIKTTCGNGGWLLYKNNNSYATTGNECLHDQTDNVTIIPTLGYTVGSSGTEYIQMKYILRNNSDTTKTNYAMAIGADTMIGSMDSAPITRTEYGLTMSDNEGHTLALIADETVNIDGLAGRTTTATSIWFGEYSGHTSTSYRYTNKAVGSSVSGLDSAMIVAWNNITLEPGEVKEIKVIMGVVGSGVLVVDQTVPEVKVDNGLFDLTANNTVDSDNIFREVNYAYVSGDVSAQTSPFILSAEGFGTEREPYLIYDADDLKKIGTNLSWSADKYYALMSDIDIPNNTWTTIAGFSGVLYGNNHKIDMHNQTKALFNEVSGTIRDLTVNGNITQSANEGTAMVVKMLSGGMLENIKVTGSVTYSGTSENAYGVSALVARAGNGVINGCINEANITNTKNIYTGGILGNMYNGGSACNVTVTNCINRGTIKGLYQVGGLIGCVAPYSGCTINHLVNEGSVTGTSQGVGGIIGILWDNAACEIVISDLQNNGAVQGAFNVGGIVGNDAVKNKVSTIKNCVNNGIVKGTSTSLTQWGCVGGIVGKSVGTSHVVKNCINNGNVTAGNTAGGILGYGESKILDCFNYAEIKGTIGYSEINKDCATGGIIGRYEGRSVERCYNAGRVESTYRLAGGIIGWINVDAVVTVKDSYNTGYVKAGGYGDTTCAGGIVGSIQKNTSQITNCHSSGTISPTPSGLQSERGSGYISCYYHVTYTNVSTTVPTTAQAAMVKATAASTCGISYNSNQFMTTVSSPEVMIVSNNLKEKLSHQGLEFKGINGAVGYKTIEGELVEEGDAQNNLVDYEEPGWYMFLFNYTNRTYNNISDKTSDYTDRQRTLVVTVKVTEEDLYGKPVLVKEGNTFTVKANGSELVNIIYQLSDPDIDANVPYIYSTWGNFVKNGRGMTEKGVDKPNSDIYHRVNTKDGYKGLNTKELMDKDAERHSFNFIMTTAGWYTVLMQYKDDAGNKKYMYKYIKYSEQDVDIEGPLLEKNNNEITFKDNLSDLHRAYIQLTTPDADMSEEQLVSTYGYKTGEVYYTVGTDRYKTSEFMTDMEVFSRVGLYENLDDIRVNTRSDIMVDANTELGYRNIFYKEMDSKVYRFSKAGWYTVILCYGDDYEVARYVKITEEDMGYAPVITLDETTGVVNIEANGHDIKGAYIQYTYPYDGEDYIPAQTASYTDSWYHYWKHGQTINENFNGQAGYRTFDSNCMTLAVYEKGWYVVYLKTSGGDITQALKMSDDVFVPGFVQKRDMEGDTVLQNYMLIKYLDGMTDMSHPITKYAFGYIGEDDTDLPQNYEDEEERFLINSFYRMTKACKDNPVYTEEIEVLPDEGEGRQFGIAVDRRGWYAVMVQDIYYGTSFYEVYVQDENIQIIQDDEAEGAPHLLVKDDRIIASKDYEGGKVEYIKLVDNPTDDNNNYVSSYTKGNILRAYKGGEQEVLCIDEEGRVYQSKVVIRTITADTDKLNEIIVETAKLMSDMTSVSESEYSEVTESGHYGIDTYVDAVTTLLAEADTLLHDVDGKQSDVDDLVKRLTSAYEELYEHQKVIEPKLVDVEGSRITITIPEEYDFEYIVYNVQELTDIETGYKPPKPSIWQEWTGISQSEYYKIPVIKNRKYVLENCDDGIYTFMIKISKTVTAGEQKVTNAFIYYRNPIVVTGDTAPYDSKINLAQYELNGHSGSAIERGKELLGNNIKGGDVSEHLYNLLANELKAAEKLLEENAKKISDATLTDKDVEKTVDEIALLNSIIRRFEKGIVRTDVEQNITIETIDASKGSYRANNPEGGMVKAFIARGCFTSWETFSSSVYRSVAVRDGIHTDEEDITPSSASPKHLDIDVTSDGYYTIYVKFSNNTYRFITFRTLGFTEEPIIVTTDGINIAVKVPADRILKVEKIAYIGERSDKYDPKTYKTITTTPSDDTESPEYYIATVPALTAKEHTIFVRVREYDSVEEKMKSVEHFMYIAVAEVPTVETIACQAGGMKLKIITSEDTIEWVAFAKGSHTTWTDMLQAEGGVHYIGQNETIVIEEWTDSDETYTFFFKGNEDVCDYMTTITGITRVTSTQNDTYSNP